MTMEDAFRTSEEVGERIRELREAEDLSQRRLGEILDIHQTAVHRIETGERALTGRELMMLAEHFGVTTSSIVRREESLALLRAGDAEPEGAKRSLDEFRACIEDYFGLEALVK